MGAQPSVLKQYECGPVPFPANPSAAYERHLVFDHVVEPDGRQPARAVRGAGPVAPRPARPALAEDPADLRPREPQAGLLPVDGVPHRPVAGQQHHQPAGRAARPARPCEREGLDLARAGRAGAGRRPGQRRPGPAGRLLHRLAGHAADPGDRLRPALRVRHLPPGDPATAARSSSPTTGCAGPTRGRSSGPRETVEVPRQLRRSSCTAAARGSIPNRPTVLLGIPYDRPVVGYGGKTINTLRLWGAAAPDYFDFGEFSRGDFVGAVHDKVAGRDR